MSEATDRLDLRLTSEDKNRLRRAAALKGMPLAAFVRDAALHAAVATIANPPKVRRVSLAARLRGRASARFSTDEIMKLTRGA